MQFFPQKSEFVQVYDADKPQLVWASFLTDLETPVSALLKLAKESSHYLLFESVEGGKTRGRYSIIALDPDLLWKCEGNKSFINRIPQQDKNNWVADSARPFDSLRALRDEISMDIPDQLPPMATGLFGYMGYDTIRQIEPRVPDNNEDTIGIPDGMYMRPTITVIFDSVRDEAMIITPVFPSEDVSAAEGYRQAVARINDIAGRIMHTRLDRTLFSRYYASDQNKDMVFRSHVSQEEYCEMVEKSQEYIRAGDIFQVVPSRRLSCQFDMPAEALYRSLRHLNPSPYLFLVNFGDMALVGSSPEILVRVDANDVVTIRPLAGTRKRGKTEAEDQALEVELLEDEKERAEHLMLLDLGRNDVGRVAKVGTIKVTEQMVVERYSHVMHIVSNVEGKMREDCDAFDALMAGFPAGTLSGAPKIRAMEIIDELEPERRSFYGGTIGYFSAGGTMDTCIALRTGVIKDKTLYIQAGAGVVADSVPQAEYNETEDKAGALVEAARQAVRFL